MRDDEAVIKWIAFVMAYFALVFGASTDDVSKLERRIFALENKKCLLMAVSTPTGTTSICTPVQ